MPIKRKSAKVQPSAPTPPAIEDASEEQRSGSRMTVVTEVVGVIEEEARPEAPVTQSNSSADDVAVEKKPDTPEIPASSSDADPVPKHDISPGQDKLPSGAVVAQDTPTPEKRKEMVEELFKEEPSRVLPEISVHRNGSMRTVVVWGLIVVATAFVIGGGLLFISRGSASITGLIAKPKPTPTPSPTPTPQVPNRQDITIQVLNGGGSVGAAGKMKNVLEENGYIVTDVGNTEEYTYIQTEILVKPAQEAYLALLQQDLGEKYTVGTAAATLGDDVPYDARVIVGKE